MAEAKPFASLSSGLLARKGTAKPAMRPQGWGQGVGLEDLGWNDMGSAQAAPAFDERPEHQPSSITALTPAPRAAPAEPAAPPPVVEQQRAIQASFAEPAPEPVEPERIEPVVAAKPAEAPQPVARPAEIVRLVERQRRAPGSQAKAAFTLRLEQERHLKLRLACAVTHRSAQQIVTDALDAYLQSLPEVDAMAGHVPAKRGQR